MLKDLREGLIDNWTAREIYKVAYDESTFRQDSEKTAEMRAEARGERKRRGKLYAEFESEWVKLRPPGRLLKYFGAYPHPSKTLDLEAL